MQKLCDKQSVFGQKATSGQSSHFSKDARSVFLYPYNQSQLLQYVRYKK